jgi:tetraacyldisaccharide 4'-kinase
LTVGGTGKTPFSAWLVARIASTGRVPAIVVSGYGRDEIEVHRELNPAAAVHSADRRIDGVAAAARGGATCVVLDDGFQHRPIRRDLDIVLVAAERWQGNRRMLPRGPWREPPRAICRATHVVVTRKFAAPEIAAEVLADIAELGFVGDGGIVSFSPAGLTGIGAVDSQVERPTWLRGRRVLAISSLADPAPFLAQLRSLGAEVESMMFPDHHEFSPDDLRAIAERVASGTAIMTRKEAVKLRKGWPVDLVGFVLDQTVTMETGLPELDGAMARALGGDS